MEGVKHLAAELWGGSGQGTPVDVSHRSVAPQVGTGTHESMREGAAPSRGGSVN